MIQKISDDATGIQFKNFGSIVYLVKLNDKNVLIDTSSKENRKELVDSLKELGLNPKDINVIILTHAHYDHVENTDLFKNAKIYGDFTNKINLDHTKTKIKNIFPIQEQPIKEFQLFQTPGHTQNDIVILYKNILFTGDTIFHNNFIGRTDFPESNEEKMLNSLQFIKNLKYKILCPGH